MYFINARTDFSEGTDVNKTNASKECNTTTGIFSIIVLCFNQMSAIDVMIY